MSRRAIETGLGLGLSVFLTACASMPGGGDGGSSGYLSDAAIRRLADAVPPPRPIGSSEVIADTATSERYRTLQSSDRWLLATAHAELRPELARQHFDCALGVRFAATPTPRLTAMFDRLQHDAEAAADLAKAREFRPRPVGVDQTRPACVRITAAGRSSASYPSSSAAIGAADAGSLALAAPGQAEAVRGIGHEIGVSRAVCALHYPADVAAGEALGQAVLAEASNTPAFRDDLIAAEAELAQVRAAGLTNPGCVAERAALAAPLP